MRRWSILVYGVLAYGLFLATYLYAVGFVMGVITPKRLDGPRTVPWGEALAVNLGLLAIFAIQHSGMARPGFKRWLTRWIPQPAERSTYVLLSSVALLALFAFWRPMGGTIWDVQEPVARMAIYALAVAGWLTVLISTFLINHFDLFGLRQVWLEFRGEPYRPLVFRTPGPYRLVRHPLYVGWLMAFWFTPTMTLAHLGFAIVVTAYILIAIQLEERDLLDAHPEYAEYRKAVPMLVPRPWKPQHGVKAMTLQDDEREVVSGAGRSLS